MDYITKNAKFIARMISGVFICIFLFLVTSLKPEPNSSLPQSSNRITSLNSSTDIYRLYVDNVQYIVVVNDNSGAAIFRHQ